MNSLFPRYGAIVALLCMAPPSFGVRPFCYENQIKLSAFEKSGGGGGGSPNSGLAKSFDEFETLRLAYRGDGDRMVAEAKLYASLMPALKSTFQGMSRAPGFDSEDLATNVYLRVVESRTSFRVVDPGPSDFASWVRGFVGEEWRRQWRGHAIGESQIGDAEDQNAFSAVEGIQQSRVREHLETMITQLDSPLYRTVLMMQLDGFNQDQMREPLGLSKPKVGILVKEAMAALRESNPDEVRAESKPRMRQRPAGSTKWYRLLNPTVQAPSGLLKSTIQGRPFLSRSILWRHFVFEQDRAEILSALGIAETKLSNEIHQLPKIMDVPGLRHARDLEVTLEEKHRVQRNLYRFFKGGASAQRLREKYPEINPKSMREQILEQANLVEGNRAPLEDLQAASKGSKKTEVFVRYFVHGQSAEEIASGMGMSMGSVRTWLPDLRREANRFVPSVRVGPREDLRAFAQSDVSIPEKHFRVLSKIKLIWDSRLQQVYFQKLFKSHFGESANRKDMAIESLGNTVLISYKNPDDIFVRSIVVRRAAIPESEFNDFVNGLKNIPVEDTVVLKLKYVQGAGMAAVAKGAQMRRQRAQEILDMYERILTDHFQMSPAEITAAIVKIGD